MTSHDFLNTARKLHFLDYSDVRFLGATRWPKFRDAPIKFLMRADDSTVEQVFAALDAKDKATAA